MRSPSFMFPAIWPLLLIPTARAGCFDPSPAFPVPSWSSGAKDFQYALESIESQLSDLIKDPKYNTSSYSVEVTSSTESLWSAHHTAFVRNESRPGAPKVNGDSYYRIASITKTFTTMAILQQVKAGNLSLDDPVDKYIPELTGDGAGSIPWKDISIRILASQLSGIPRDVGQSDLIQAEDAKAGWGLPPVDEQDLPSLCGGFDNFTRSCTRDDILGYITRQEPLYAPNFKSTYSNVNFELLGLVIENVTGVPYVDYVTANVFEMIGMQHGASFEIPDESRAVLPWDPKDPDGFRYWDAELGALAPTGAIYASSSAMSKYLRYILTHYNSLAKGVNWFLPQSFSESRSYYGMPWEMYRHPVSAKGNAREVTFVTKGGGLPGYTTIIALLPEYGIGITLLTGGNPTLLGQIAEIVIGSLIPALERTIWYDIDAKYTGRYEYQGGEENQDSGKLNTSLTLATSLQAGLQLTTFISNSSNVMAKLMPDSPQLPPHLGRHVQLVPTLLFKNESSQSGEKWRFFAVPERSIEDKGIFVDFCIADDDRLSYAGRPLNEMILWPETGHIELPAWGVTLKKVADANAEDGGTRFVVQDPHGDL